MSGKSRAEWLSFDEAYGVLDPAVYKVDPQREEESDDEYEKWLDRKLLEQDSPGPRRAPTSTAARGASAAPGGHARQAKGAPPGARRGATPSTSTRGLKPAPGGQARKVDNGPMPGVRSADKAKAVERKQQTKDAGSRKGHPSKDAAAPVGQKVKDAVPGPQKRKADASCEATRPAGSTGGRPSQGALAAVTRPAKPCPPPASRPSNGGEEGPGRFRSLRGSSTGRGCSIDLG
mmetsp:Transcript_57277/g.179898  ORF Transcript_57277/g.179898 Transcript_57277/m.179898 type:complete len:233 (-) Transcript_57277:99-797(-)